MIARRIGVVGAGVRVESVLWHLSDTIEHPESRPTDFVVSLRVRGKSVAVFRSNENGEVLLWEELTEIQGPYSHSDALRDLEWEVIE